MAEEIALGHVIVVTLVHDGDDRAGRNDAIGSVFDHRAVFEQFVELANTAFHHALVIFGSVVITIFREVAHFACTFDDLRDLEPAAGREVVVFCLQARISGLRELGSFECRGGHRGTRVSLSFAVRTSGLTVTGRDCEPVQVTTHKVAVIGGDGIGPEVTAEALKVVRAAGVSLETTDFDLGGARYLRDGVILPDEVLADLRNYDVILLGAVGTPAVPPGVIERGLLLKMRFELDLYVNQRPFIGTGPGRTEPHDFVVIRENTEGPYVGEGGVLRKGTLNEVATQGSVNTRMGAERAIRYAFELATTRRNHVTLVHKTNVLTFAGDLWQRTFDIVAADYPGVGTAYNHVDAACIYFVQDPGRYDVIVTDNLFGDILTDLGGAISGGIGLASSANLNPARTGPSMFEPVHGSAPDIVGTGKANPIAAILSAALMLDHLGEGAAAARVRAACTPEPSGTTTEIADIIAARLGG
jgi:3-isopropylmalate dehydrogenase